MLTEYTYACNIEGGSLYGHRACRPITITSAGVPSHSPALAPGTTQPVEASEHSRPPATISELPADVLDVATCDRDLALDDLIRQRAYRKLQQVTRAVNRMDDVSYGMCHLCRHDIPLPRLRAQPDATLCVDCKAESEHRALMRAGV